MPHEDFYDLGRDDSSRIEPVGAEKKLSYPTISMDSEMYPPLKDMKLGDMGMACVKYKVNEKYGGIEILAMKEMPMSPDAVESSDMSEKEKSYGAKLKED